MLTPANIKEIEKRNSLNETEVMQIADFYKKEVFLPFIETMLEQMDTRLIKPEPHFRATWLLPLR